MIHSLIGWSTDWLAVEILYKQLYDCVACCAGLYSDEGLSTVVRQALLRRLFHLILTHLHILWHGAVSTASLVVLLFTKSWFPSS